MIRAGITRPLCVYLIVLLAVHSGFAQAPPVPTTPGPSVPRAPGTPLTIGVLEGANAINSIPLLSSVAVTIEVRDSDDYPVEDASVTFTLPAQGTGGTFTQGGKTFATRSDARGQAIAPAVIPTGLGKFKIAVTATAGDRKGEIVVDQTNSAGAYVGPPPPKPAWYKRKIFWALGGAAIAAIIVVIELHGSSSSPVVITPGTPGIVP